MILFDRPFSPPPGGAPLKLDRRHNPCVRRQRFRALRGAAPLKLAAAFDLCRGLPTHEARVIQGVGGVSRLRGSGWRRCRARRPRAFRLCPRPIVGRACFGAFGNDASGVRDLLFRKKVGAAVRRSRTRSGNALDDRMIRKRPRALAPVVRSRRSTPSRAQSSARNIWSLARFAASASAQLWMNRSTSASASRTPVSSMESIEWRWGGWLK